MRVNAQEGVSCSWRVVKCIVPAWAVGSREERGIVCRPTGAAVLFVDPQVQWR